MSFSLKTVPNKYKTFRINFSEKRKKALRVNQQHPFKILINARASYPELQPMV